MTGRRILTLALLLASAISAWANGDPVAVRSALTLSPTPVAVHIPEVQLVDEHISFVPHDRYMEVTVRYLLHNRSARSFDSLPYGFPIDYYGSGKSHWTDIDDIFESQMEEGWRDDLIRNVSFTLGDRQLHWRCSKDTVLVPPQPYLSEAWFDTASEKGRREFDSLFAIYGDSVYSYTHGISRRWFYTYLTIPANSFVTLEVRYTVECNVTQDLYSLCDYMTVDNSIWYLRFQYDFTPAAYWGDGHADRFNVVLDTTEICKINYENVWLKGIGLSTSAFNILPFRKESHLWTYHANQFDLATAKPLQLAYTLKKPISQPLDKLLNHRLDPSKYTITVSGTDPKYPAANLSDLDPSTATVLRPDKQDSVYITIRFKKPTEVAALLLINGYTKDRDTWRNNARIDSLLVTAITPGYTYHNYETGRIDTALNNTDRQHIMLFGEHEWIRKWVESRWLPGKYPHDEPEDYDLQSLIDNSFMLTIGSIWSGDLVSEIKLRITATAKGLKYDDLCVSEIILIKR